MRYNFDRHLNGFKLSMGISVHANSMEEALKKAREINLRYAKGHYGEGQGFPARLVFRDNAPCLPYFECPDCREGKIGC